MNKKKIALLILLLTAIAFSMINCKHELPVSCAELGFKVSVTKTDALLNLPNGTLTATATGGSGFQYSLNGSAFKDSGYFAGLPAFGTYKIVGRNAAGCSDTVDVSIGSFNPCSGVVVNIVTTKVDATLNQSNGSITANVAGSAGVTYSINGGTFQSGGHFANLAAGNYTIAAKTSVGCLGTAQVSIGSNNPCSGVTVTVATTQVQPTGTQANGSITASATGGSGFTYKLNSGNYQTSGTFSALAAGNYTITAKNSNGCTGSVIVALGANNPCAGVTVAVTTSQVNPSGGLATGSITATATGGTGFTYSINTGAYQASGLFSNLSAGTFTISAKNSNGCLGTKQVTLAATSPCTNVNITVAASVVNTVPCSSPTNNGSITATAGGSTGLTYNLNGGAYQTGNLFLNLNAATYLVGVKDVNGCTKTLSVIVGVVPQGVTFAPVRALITAKCGGSGCHMNGAGTAGYNFDTDCSIVTYWSQINGSCVTGTLKKMPKSPQTALTTAQKQTITNWINAGHTYNK